MDINLGSGVLMKTSEKSFLGVFWEACQLYTIPFVQCLLFIEYLLLLMNLAL